MDEEYFRGVICYFLNFILEAVAWPIISHFYFVLYAFERSKIDPGILWSLKPMVSYSRIHFSVLPLRFID